LTNIFGVVESAALLVDSASTSAEQHHLYYTTSKNSERSERSLSSEEVLMEAMMVQLKRFLGVSAEYKKKRHYEIKLDIVGDSAVKMNVESFRKSSAVKKQISAARSYTPQNETDCTVS